MILKPKVVVPVVHRGSVNEVKPPKFSLRRVWTVLDVFALELHELDVSMDSGTMVLAVDAIDLSKRNRLVAKLQKRAIPKSEWEFSRDVAAVYGNVNGRIVSILVFTRRRKR